MKVGIIGGSGYTGGELLRLCCQHPGVEIGNVTSSRYKGKRVSSIHPNLRKVLDRNFVGRNEIGDADAVFLATPHGGAMQIVPELLGTGVKVFDLSADFRLRDPSAYPTWYGAPHTCPDLLGKAVYGIPELHREEIKRAELITGAGCLATSAILALFPLCKHQVIDPDTIIVDSKVGSSAAGNEPSLSTHHPERAGTMRPYAVVGHRHTAEMLQELGNWGKVSVSFSAHAVEAVRGILSTSHVFLKEGLFEEGAEEREIWKIYRREYGSEPFIRIVKERTGLYRLPEPKVVLGTNNCDIGFLKDPFSSRLVVLSAIDNLIKGAAGQGIQCLNIRFGLPETMGLEMLGFHPI